MYNVHILFLTPALAMNLNRVAIDQQEMKASLMRAAPHLHQSFLKVLQHLTRLLRMYHPLISLLPPLKDLRKQEPQQPLTQSVLLILIPVVLGISFQCTFSLLQWECSAHFYYRNPYIPTNSQLFMPHTAHNWNMLLESVVIQLNLHLQTIEEEYYTLFLYLTNFISFSLTVTPFPFA